PAIPVLENILGSGASVVGGVAAPVTGALGSTPVIGDIISGPSSSAAAPAASSGNSAPASPVGGALAPVTGTLGSVPIVGGLLGGS
ncbi:MAG: hypothetical protein RID59_19355, partial [Hoeflea sp.]